MKYLLTLILIMACFLYAVSQEVKTVSHGSIIISDTELVYADERTTTANGSYGFGFTCFTTRGGAETINASSPNDMAGGFQYVAGSASRRMLNDDDALELLAVVSNNLVLLIDSPEPTDEMQVLERNVQFVTVEQREDGAYVLWYYSDRFATGELKLAGNTPTYDYHQRLYNMYNQQQPVRVDTVRELITERIFTSDTVYLSETISRIDTVRELITERIFTSDTVYLQETITLEGDVDTVFVNRTFTTRDTVYNETTITQVSIDSVFLVGGQYAKDVVLAVDKALNSETLQAYPNPASEAVTISSEASGNVELKIYDTLGKVMESVPLSGGPHDTVISVADYGSGVYLYMLIGENGRSSTKRFIVD